MLRNILESVISTDNFEEHIRIVKRDSQRRKLKTLGEEAYMYSDSDISLSGIQEFLSSALDQFSDSESHRAMSAAEGFRNFMDNIGVKKEYIETGIKVLDKTLKISKGDYIVLGARPSVGKTAFALQVAWEMGFKHKVVFYSFETSTEKIYNRVVSAQARINFGQIVNGTVPESDKPMVEYAMDGVLKNSFKCIEASGMTVAEIQASAVREKAEIIFIDYLGLINSGIENKALSSYETVTKISKDLHTLAQRRKIAIFALAQLNRQGDEKEPSLTSLRDSGQIEQDADAVLLLARHQDKDSVDEESGRALSIAKNKEGTLGKILFFFNGENQRFVPMDTSRKE
jgi:replicative DNA helicase